jgi:uncharacterized membrane protein YphA (DoxX/SURF4 family)
MTQHSNTPHVIRRKKLPTGVVPEARDSRMETDASAAVVDRENDIVEFDRHGAAPGPRSRGFYTGRPASQPRCTRWVLVMDSNNRGRMPMPPRLTNSQAFAGLRIAVGVLFLIFAQYKVFGTQFTLGGGFQYWINLFLKAGAYPFMVGILRHFVLPHATPIAFLVAYGELAIGLSLVSGILVRLASIFGMIFMLTLLFSANYPGPDVPLWRYFGGSLEHSVFFLCFLAFAVSNPAEALSLARLRWWTPRKPSRPLH